MKSTLDTGDTSDAGEGGDAKEERHEESTEDGAEKKTTRNQHPVVETAEELNRKAQEDMECYCAISTILMTAIDELKEDIPANIKFSRQFLDSVRVRIYEVCACSGELAAIDTAKAMIVEYIRKENYQKQKLNELKLKQYMERQNKD